MASSIDAIRNQFNSEKRIKESLKSYGINSEINDVEYDPYEKLREDHILKQIKSAFPEPDKSSLKALDIGCGLGTLVVNLLDYGIDPFGFDLAEKAIDQARTLLSEKGYANEKVDVGNLFDLTLEGQYDMAIANGVIWYYDDKGPFLEKVNSALRTGGKSYIVHRNDLFNIFAMNSGTRNFFDKHFMSYLSDEEKTLKNNEEYWADMPAFGDAVQKHNSSKLEKPYDNPLNIAELYEKYGFEVEKVTSVYVHPLPPRYLKQTNFDDSHYLRAQEEFGESWEGLFMGSQFVVEAVKK